MGSATYGLRPTSVSASSADVSAPSSSTAAVITYAAVPGKSHHINNIYVSYVGGAPAGGNLKIEDGSGTVIFNIDIAAAGTYSFSFGTAKRGTANTAMIITLTDPGDGVTGKLSVGDHWTE
jgi:hypothetical protein